MNALRPLFLAVVALIGATQLTAQQNEPRRGKIDRVEGEARPERRDDETVVTSDDEGGGGFWMFGFLGNIIKAIRSEPGQGYLPYPYADRRALETFVLRDVTKGRGFGAITTNFYDDVGSTTRAGHFAWDGAVGGLHGNFELTFYRERTQTDTDAMAVFRLGVGGLPPLGYLGFARVGLALRGVVLDNGVGAGGPELEFGAQLFPRRPWTVGGTTRVAGLVWDTGKTSLFYEGAASAGLVLGRVELQAGYRWMKIGGAPWFSGPTIGMRLWL